MSRAWTKFSQLVRALNCAGVRVTEIRRVGIAHLPVQPLGHQLDGLDDGHSRALGQVDGHCDDLVRTNGLTVAEQRDDVGFLLVGRLLEWEYS